MALKSWEVQEKSTYTLMNASKEEKGKNSLSITLQAYRKIWFYRQLLTKIKRKKAELCTFMKGKTPNAEVSSENSQQKDWGLTNEVSLDYSKPVIIFCS